MEIAADPGPRLEHEVPLWRLYVMRGIALLFVISGFTNYLPGLLEPSLTARGVSPAMFGGLWLVAFLALRHPVLMVPIYLFEFVWKSVWLLAFGLPQWSSGRVDPQLDKDLWEIGAFSVVFALIIPWGYVWRRYVKEPGDRWL